MCFILWGVFFALVLPATPTGNEEQGTSLPHESLLAH